ncbi:DEAD/DEAH box helicase family protein [Microbulbifer sp. CAU 1566]|uniref:DEAD/DEAH box helicase n=1 Tax=Microbulbifer sp. CAU 1566 TaxID=2933269 RepID=UPI0020039ABF|nr:DEAD/DEAH box helicase family protein [Microbulbifer sp. CAU 1566]MCK7596802.1 DEAD/DEAH box helicase family protein [Microbulbifer sp. CAU 1566]
MQLRKWQSECISQALEYYSTGKTHFMCLATPGAGKTVMASTLANQLFDSNLIDLVICFSPSVVVAEDFRYELEQITGNRIDGLLGSSGSSLTYQSLRNLGERFWALFEQYRVFVIFDEIHHCAGNSIEYSNAWGEKIITHIQGRASYTLALTGTPWRSDLLPVVLANYCDENHMVHCDYQYGLNEAILDSVCRTPVMIAIDNNQVQFQRDDDSKLYRSFRSLLTESDCTYQELLESRDLILYCLNQANQKLDSLRTKKPNSGGLIVATSIAHAEKIHAILAGELGEHADIVTHKNENSISTIHNFKKSDRKWIISVGMISEGTNIPRLQVCCHLTRVKTELYFRQILGRILRSGGGPNEIGYMYFPAEPTLMDYAERIESDIPNTATIKSFLSKNHDQVSSVEILPRSNVNSQKSGTISFSPQEPEVVYSTVRVNDKRQDLELPIDATYQDSDLSRNYLRSINISGNFIRKRLSPQLAKSY